LHGSASLASITVIFSDGSTGGAFAQVGADHITGGSGGGDSIFGDGGPDVVTLPNHSLPDAVTFGETKEGITTGVLAITDGKDMAYPGYWGVSTTPTAIPTLFSGSTGGTSADMTAITGFGAGSSGDELEFRAAAWNGSSAGFANPKGDLVTLNGALDVQPGAEQLSKVWVNSASNSSLKASDTVLLYAPSDASLLNAQQLAAQLHKSADAIVLPGSGHIAPSEDKHILVAYDASGPLASPLPFLHIADVDLVNTSASNQTSTANLDIYASDMVSLVGVSLSSLTSANIHFI
jgi:hypothetical protein